MAQEFFINSQELEDQVRKLLPSQGGLGAGFDLSASTQIIPIIDLTESAEGSGLRSDLQTALSFSSITSFNVTNATSTLITNTGYFRVFGNVQAFNVGLGTFQLNDGTSNKNIVTYEGDTNSAGNIPFDFNVFLKAGDLLRCICSNANILIVGNTRQLASIDNTLVNP